jgi:pyruvate,water dikinase
MITLAQKLPNINSSTEKEKSWAYLLGAISTDGSVYLSKNHGEVQFIQKPTEEKKKFIEEVQNCMIKSFKKPFSICRKKASSGSIRGKPAIGEANAYRCYSKQIAIEVLQHKKELVQTLLCCDEEVIYSFLAGVIDGDGSFNKISDRINIYVSKKDLLESIIVSCLRLGFVPQVSVNRSIYNVQIVEKVRDILNYTKRVKGSSIRTKFGTRFFSAKQIFGNSAKIRTMKSRIDKNLLVDETIIKKMIDDFDKNNQEKISKIISSDTRMQRVNFVRDVGYKDVYNITVADNNNYIVFTDRYTPILVNNCHAAIISRELGIPCVVGTNNGTKKIKNNETITVSCADGEEGFVYEGKVPYRIEKINVKNFKKPKTKIMMNIGNPESAFEMSFIPNEGVGLAREEFIINEYIKIHPKALINFDKIKDASVKQQIEKMTYGYKNKADFFVNKLAQGVAMIGAAFYPKDVIVRMSDFKTNEYANLIGGKEYEPKEENPMIGWRGASRYYSDYKDAFALECRAMKKAREEFGLTNIKLMVPFCRTIEEGKKVIAEMEKNGLYRGKDGLQVYVMCEIPSNVILADEFAEIFDGFSIGSNDLTQLTLGLDRDSQLVSHIYNERNMAVKKLIALVISKCRKNNRKIGICGQAPSDFPDFAQFLVECGIDSISLNPDTVVKTTMAILQTEKKLKK